jgi:hypothetical protein
LRPKYIDIGAALFHEATLAPQLFQVHPLRTGDLAGIVEGDLVFQVGPAISEIELGFFVNRLAAGVL